MKIFTAWSGNTSKKVAQILREWLPKFLPFVEVWMSEEDIAKGTLWNIELWKNLQEADFGILCIVPDNVEGHWILFEAGALSGGKARNRVSPFLIGVKDIDLPDPLNQFQSTFCQKKDVKKLIAHLNELVVDKLSKEELNSLYEKYWPQLRSRLNLKKLTKNTEKTKNKTENDNKTTTKEIQLDNTCLSILKTLALSLRKWTAFRTIRMRIRKPPNLIAMKVTELEILNFIHKGTNKQRVVFYRISNKGMQYLIDKKLI